ncbi:hypothetical protein GF377_05780 [candidate division GN15 bacterium]|nr:hypothetical protein [candidate division GN15 bacterium]
MPYLGDYFIFIATVCAVASATLYLLAWRGRNHLLGMARQFFRLMTAFVLASLGTLMYLIITHDFSVIYVFQYSSTELPLYYLISTLWGGQEGTFVLWISLASVMGLVMMNTAKSFERGNMFWLSLFVLSILVILIKKSPFELMPVFRAEGSGLNPLLVNFWMTIHPPIMFVGFAATVFPFCFGLTALVERKYQVWSEAARRWTLFAWTTLGLAIVLGGYWAYETLGWGGYWAWDPVENASFIPWIFLTAQLHTLYVKRQRRGLMRFSLAMVMLTFWSVLYGTFLTRSGVLADFSVHSFVDLGINQYLVGGLLTFVAIGLFLMIVRWRDIKPEKSFSTVNSRTYLTALGIVVIFVGGLLVLLGTSAPLLTRVTDNPSSVSLNYYFVTMTPVAVVCLFLIALMPAFRWEQGMHKPRLLVAGGIAAVIAVAVLLVTGTTFQIIYLLLFAAAAAALVTNGWVLMRSLKNGRVFNAYLAHVGLAVMLLGAAASTDFGTNHTISVPQNGTVSVQGYDLTFAHVVNTEKGFDCHVNVEKGGSRFTAVLPHEFPKNSEGVMRKPYVKNYLLSDLYISPLALEQPEQTTPGQVYLEKDQTDHLDKYHIRFVDFETVGHGEGMDDMSAAALLEISYDGQTEEVRPALIVQGTDIQPTQVAFDGGRGEVSIAGVRPEHGGVVLQFAGDFVPAGQMTASMLVLEISSKPLIQVFWLGTFLIFLAGVLTIVRRSGLNGTAPAAVDDRTQASSSPPTETAATPGS